MSRKISFAEKQVFLRGTQAQTMTIHNHLSSFTSLRGTSDSDQLSNLPTDSANTKLGAAGKSQASAPVSAPSNPYTLSIVNENLHSSAVTLEDAQAAERLTTATKGLIQSNGSQAEAAQGNLRPLQVLQLLGSN